MWVSKDFIFIHVPKTGGNFVRAVLVLLEKSLHLPRIRPASGKWRVFLSGWYWRTVLEMWHATPTGWRVSLHRSLAKSLYRRKGKASLLLIRWLWTLRRTFDRLYPQRWSPRDLMLHANCECIPEAHQHKPVLSIKRDPLAYHVSCYCYRDGAVFWWRKRYWHQQYQQAASRKEEDRINSRQEEIPDFGEFVRFFNEELPRMHFFRHKRCRLPSSIGFMSYIYIWYFFREPMKVLSKTDAQLAEYFESQRYRQDMCRVHFLRTGHLNADLHDFLLSGGFDREVLRFIPAQEKANVSVKKDPETWFTPGLIDYIEEKNWIYYRYFWRDDSAGSTETLDGRV